jgi:hypothetical protein
MLARSPHKWKSLVEAAIFETNPDILSRRIQDAQEAIMNEIEDSFHTASQSERQALLSAMKALRELRRVSQIHGSQPGTREFSSAA